MRQSSEETLFNEILNERIIIIVLNETKANKTFYKLVKQDRHSLYLRVRKVFLKEVMLKKSSSFMALSMEFLKGVRTGESPTSQVL
jgi:hypothetical protein